MFPLDRFGMLLVYILLAMKVRAISSVHSDEDWPCRRDVGSSRGNPSEIYTSHFRPLFTPRYSPYESNHILDRHRPHNSNRPAHHFTSSNIETASSRFGPAVAGPSSPSGNIGSSRLRRPRSRVSELSRAPTCERAGPRRGARGPRVAEVAAPEAERVRDKTRCFPKKPTDETVYSFQLTDAEGKTRRLKSKRYKGKVLLIVVMATFHPLFSPQILGLHRLQEKYEGDLKILAFPTNQFRITENGANHTEVMNIMYFVRPGQGFVPAFEVYPPCAVNGAEELPLFSHLKAACPPTRTGYMEPLTDLKYDPVRDSDVRDAYEKFLVSGQGVAVARYDARVPPEHLDSAIEEQIDKMDMMQ